MNLSLLVTTFSFCILSLALLVCSISDSELRSLLEFKKGIQEDPLGKVKDSWDPSRLSSNLNACTSWNGVICDGDGDSLNVTGIVLDRLGLAGKIFFHTLTGLKMLKKLSVSGNNFSGRVAPVLGTITTLQYLDLSDNEFYGPIPARMNDLWGLNYLNLSVNNFSSSFPSGIRNLQQLKALDLHGNRLEGDITVVLSELRNVEYLDLSYNMFYGGISMSLENMSSLANTVRHLNLSHNKLDGGFFKNESIGLFRNLEVMDLGDNQISGELPSFGSRLKLRLLRLGGNRLSGKISGELLESSVLEELDLSRNGFTGSILGINSTTLKVLNLSSNGFSGSLPTLTGSCVIMDLSRNMVSGDISVMQNWMAPLQVLDLSSNKLSGSFPDLTSQFDRITSLILSNNLVVGTLPSTLGTHPSLAVVDLSLNELTGPVPGSLFTSVTLISLNLSGNNFSGPIPFPGSRASELLVESTDGKMEYLDLSNNSLNGSLPSDIEKMASLKLLNLAKNAFSGQIPGALNKLDGLEYLDLSHNRFVGEIPDKLPFSLNVFNVSYNYLRGKVPENLKRFPMSSFRPGNEMLSFPHDFAVPFDPNHISPGGRHHSSKGSIKLAIILASLGAAAMIVFVLVAYHQAHLKEFRGRNGFSDQDTGRDVKLGRFTRPSLFKFQRGVQTPPTSLSFSTDHLLTSNSRALPGQTEFVTEPGEHKISEGLAASSASLNPNVLDNPPATSGRKSSPGSPLSSSPRFVEASEQPVMLDVYSPDRLAGELSFLDGSLAFTAEDLSRAPAEVLGRSSHGTLYKATLDSGHMLTVKWLRVGLVKHKKEFAREVKRIGSIRHAHIVPLRAYYWGPREQERLLLADYIHGDSLALHLYESTPRRYSPLSFSQRLKVAMEVARCLLHLHDRGLPHGNLKPTNILLEGPDYNARLTDYGLHRLMTSAGIGEQILNLGALGYCAPELASAVKPVPSFKADVYALGVIVMELLTRRSAGDIISGQSGAVDLTDWVQLCDQEGRRMDCIDRDIAGGEEPSRAMDELLGISLRCILPVNERPNIRQVLDDLCTISV